jgi:hypothetical protein
MKKETAVEWLIDAIRNQIAEGTLNAISISELKMKAKEMEKEQILGAYLEGESDADHYEHSATKYYNQRYK